jgi:hypothetical protein
MAAISHMESSRAGHAGVDRACYQARRDQSRLKTDNRASNGQVRLTRHAALSD